jgi:hypothetical protein
MPGKRPWSLLLTQINSGKEKMNQIKTKDQLEIQEAILAYYHDGHAL